MIGISAHLYSVKLRKITSILAILIIAFVVIDFRFTDEDVDEMYREAPIKNGMFDYTEFTRILKHGAKEKDEA